MMKSQLPDLERVPTEDVFAACEAILGVRPEDLSADRILACLPGVHITMLAGAERMNEDDRVAATEFLATPFQGQIWVLTDAGSAKGLGAFVVAPHELRDCSDAHRRLTGERMFSGQDMVAVDSGHTTLWLYHHGGGYVVIRRPGCQSSGQPLASPWELCMSAWFSRAAPEVQRIAVDSTGRISHDEGELRFGSWQLATETTSTLSALLGVADVAALRSAPLAVAGWCHHIELRAPSIRGDATLSMLPQAVRDIEVTLGHAIRARREEERAALGPFFVELTAPFRSARGPAETVSVDEGGQLTLRNDGGVSGRLAMPPDRVAYIALLLRLAAQEPAPGVDRERAGRATLRLRTVDGLREVPAFPPELPPALGCLVEELYRDRWRFRGSPGR